MIQKNAHTAAHGDGVIVVTDIDAAPCASGRANNQQRSALIDSLMLDKLIQFSIRQRWLVLLVVLGVCGAWASTTISSCRSTPCRTSPTSRCRSTPRRRATRRSKPSSASPSRSRPRWAGLPRLEYTRSLSRYGLSQVTVVFEDGTDIYFARQLVSRAAPAGRRASCRRASSRRWARSRPASARSSCTRSRPSPARCDADGEPYTPTDLRTLQDWIIRPQLRNVPGVDRGQHDRRLREAVSTSRPHPAKLVAYGLTLARRRCRRSRRNNANVGAGYIERNGEQYLIRAPGQVQTHRRDRATSCSARATACRSASRDVAEVALGKELRTGAATAERPGSRARHRLHADRREQPHRLARRRRASWRRSTHACPRASSRETVYDRTDAGRRHDRDREEEPARRRAARHRRAVPAARQHPRGADHGAAIIPLSMLLTITGMVADEDQRQPDEPRRARLRPHRRRRGDHRRELPAPARAKQQQHRPRLLALGERFDVVFEATREVISPSMFGVLHHHRRLPADPRATGVEGKMFHPMALTVMLALAARDGPVAHVRARGRRAVPRAAELSEKENFFMRCARRALRAAAPHGALHARGRRRDRRGRARRARACSWPRAWAASSSRASTKATSPCTRCAFPAPA